MISDTEEKQPRIDAVTHAMETIDYAHHKIHVGSSYYLSGSSILALATNTLGFVATTPSAASWMHMLWQMSSSGPITIAVYEGSSGITGGTPSVPVNSNRNSLNISGAVVLINPTVATPGTQIAGAAFGTVGTNKFAPTGGGTDRDSEIILKQSTAYYWKVTANDALITVSYFANWYEHTSKD